MRRATVVRKTALVRSNTAANIAVRSPFNTSVGLMAAGAGIKVSLQVQPTDTIGRIRIRLVRAIAWRSIRSRHPRGRDGRLASVARANEIETAAGFQTKDRPEADVALVPRSWIGRWLQESVECMDQRAATIWRQHPQIFKQYLTSANCKTYTHDLSGDRSNKTRVGGTAAPALLIWLRSGKDLTYVAFHDSPQPLFAGVVVQQITLSATGYGRR
jgi:hypothetical protein